MSIHKHLFQDVYSWAGKRRKVEISKAGKQFFPRTHFDNAFRFIVLTLKQSQYCNAGITHYDSK